jgi:phosphonate dehydrogenase
MTTTVVFPQAPMASTLERLDASTQVVINDTDSAWPAERLREATRDADALVAFMTERVDARLVADSPRLRVVAGALKGTDNIDIGACTRQGIWVTAVPDLLTVPTAELAVGLMLGLARHLRLGDAQVREGDFSGWRPQFYGMGLAGGRVGLVGMGAIGRAIIQRLAGFDCTIRYHDPHPLHADEPVASLCEQTDLETILTTSDFIVMATPLTDRTRHLIGAHALARVNDHALLINPSRGSVVDEQAIAEALAAGRLGGYAADVFEMEDLSRTDRPASIPKALREHPRTLFTPHLGSAVMRNRREIEHHAVDNVRRVLDGEPPQDPVNQPLANADRC